MLIILYTIYFKIQFLVVIHRKKNMVSKQNIHHINNTYIACKNHDRNHNCFGLHIFTNKIHKQMTYIKNLSYNICTNLFYLIDIIK